MSLKKTAKSILDTWPSLTGATQTLAATDGDQRLECDICELDSLGCAFERFEVSADRLNGAGVDRLKKIGEALSARLTYLLEPISPIEIDLEGCVVQMRSNPPHKDDDGTKYYELLASRDGRLSLARYSKSSSDPRQRIAAYVTREVWLRLVDDFSAVAATV